MAIQRIINTKFWSDNWIRKINPLDRYLFLYLISNGHTNISGIYELSLDIMAFETGIKEEDLERAMLPRLKPKVFYIDGWVFLANFQKHQATDNEKIRKGIMTEMNKAPEKVIKKICEVLSIPYTYPIDTLCIPYAYPSDNLIKSNSIKDASQKSDATHDKKEKEKPIGHKEVFEYFQNKVKEECHVSPTFNGGKDGQAVKRALKAHSLEDVKRIIDFYLNGEKVEKFGYNLSIALSADTINKWLREEMRLR